MIRQAVTDDEDQITNCAQVAYRRYVPLIGREPAPMSADYAALIAAGEVWIAPDDRDDVLGFIVFRREGEFVLLENVAVLPEAAGRGIGKALIAFCEEAAQLAGASGLRLYTNVKMVENLAIYPRLGYVEIGRREEDGFRRVYFEKRLNGAPGNAGG